MGHLATLEGVYVELTERLHRYPIGAPPAKQLYEILKILYSEEEAQVAAQFPMLPVPFVELQKRIGLEPERLRSILNSLADKALILEYKRRGEIFYSLSPTVVGFFEYTFMKFPNPDLPLKELAHLMHDYFLEGGFGKEIFGSKTQRARTLVVEGTIAHLGPEVLPYEKASDIIRGARYGALTTCYCRHAEHHLGTACTSPMTEVCTILGPAAEFLVRRGFARRAEPTELLDVLDRTEELGLCHIADNVQQRVAFICHCCRCCCDLLAGNNKLGLRHSVAPSNYVSVVDQERCTGCKTCSKRCPVRAISFVEVDGRKEWEASIDESICLGCGLCNSVCWVGALSMEKRKEPVVPPSSFKEQQMRIAAEKGRALG